jgi:hypothetical protein
MSKRDGFSPGVAARITGVTANVQRVWAQRYPGLVPPTAGPHRRFDLSDLCRLRAARRASADEVTCSSPRPVTLVDLAAIGWDLGHRLATMHWKRGERAEEVRPWA